VLEWIIGRDSKRLCVNMQGRLERVGEALQGSHRGITFCAWKPGLDTMRCSQFPTTFFMEDLMEEIESPAVISNREKAKAKQFGWTKMMVLYHGVNG
jgi:hypothetical protein